MTPKQTGLNKVGTLTCLLAPLHVARLVPARGASIDGRHPGAAPSLRKLLIAEPIRNPSDVLRGRARSANRDGALEGSNSGCGHSGGRLRSLCCRAHSTNGLHWRARSAAGVGATERRLPFQDARSLQASLLRFGKPSRSSTTSRRSWRFRLDRREDRGRAVGPCKRVAIGGVALKGRDERCVKASLSGREAARALECVVEAGRQARITPTTSEVGLSSMGRVSNR